MPKPKVIVFDLDGTIFDSEGLGFQEMCRLYPGFNEEIHKEMLCGNFFESRDKMKLTKIPETDEEIETRRKVYVEKKLKCLAYVGMLELIQELHNEGYILALNTSERDQNCLPLLAAKGLDKLFEFIGTRDISASKIEKFKQIMEKYNVLGQEMLFISDSLGDLHEAKVSGVPTIAVTWGIHDRSYFTREPHENLVAIVDTVADLREKILNK